MLALYYICYFDAYCTLFLTKPFCSCLSYFYSDTDFKVGGSSLVSKLLMYGMNTMLSDRHTQILKHEIFIAVKEHKWMH